MPSTSRSAFCSRCGQFNPESSYLCARCGKYLRGAKRSITRTQGKGKRDSSRVYEVKPRFDFRLPAVLTFAGASIAGLIVFFLQSNDSIPKPESRLVTTKQYNQILPGMAYEDAVKIIGDPGDLSTAQSPAKNVTLANYRWKNPDGSFLSLVVQNNQVISKSEQNLPSSEMGS